MPIIFLPNEYLEYELHSRADDEDGDLWLVLWTSGSKSRLMIQLHMVECFATAIISSSLFRFRKRNIGVCHSF